MPSKPFSDLLADPRFKELSGDEQSSTIDRYWDAFKTERPENAEFADSQRASAKAMLDLRKRAETATEAEKRLLRPIQNQIIDSIAIGNDRAWGRIDDAEFKRRVDESKKRQAELDKDADNVRSYYNPERIKTLADLIGGESAKELAGGKTGLWEGAKGDLNEIGDIRSEVTRVVVSSGGDLDKAESILRKRSGQTTSNNNPYGGLAYSQATSANAAELDHLEKLKTALGDVPAEERLPILQDVAKMTAWTEDESVRRLSVGGVVFNPQKLFGDKNAVLSQLDSMKLSADDKARAREQFEQMRQDAIDPTVASLMQYDSGFESSFRSAMASPEGVGNKADFVDRWMLQQEARGRVAKSLDALWSGVVVNGGIGVVKTALGTIAGLGSIVGAGETLGGIYDFADRTASGMQQAQQMRGLTGGYGVTKDIAGTVTQMMPMIIGGSYAQGMKGLSAAATAGMSVYGWAGMQGYESALSTELELAREQRGSLTGADVEEVLGSGKAQLAGFANAVQTAALSKILGGGAEAAALGKTGAAMTVRDFLSRGGRSALQDSTLRKELKGMAKNIFKHATDEAVEETLNQVLENTIASRIQNADRKLGDVIGESVYAGALGALAGGALPQFNKSKRPDTEDTSKLPTYELDDATLQARADAALAPNLAPEKELPKGTTPAGADKNAGPAPVAGTATASPLVEMTPDEFSAAKQERIAELRAVENPSPDEAAELKLLDTASDEEIAKELGVNVVKPQETLAPAAAQPTETLPAGSAVTPGGVAIPTATIVAEPTQTNEEDQKGQGQGRQEVLTMPEAPPVKAGGASLDTVVESAKANGVSIRAAENPAGITLFGIETSKEQQRKGRATQAITDLKRVADEKQIPISLTVEPSSEMSKPTLINWYSKQGFELQSDGETMVYSPPQQQTTQTNATEKGNQQQGDLGQYTPGNETRKASETGDSNRTVGGGQKQAQEAQVASPPESGETATKTTPDSETVTREQIDEAVNNLNEGNLGILDYFVRGTAAIMVRNSEREVAMHKYFSKYPSEEKSFKTYRKNRQEFTGRDLSDWAVFKEWMRHRTDVINVESAPSDLPTFTNAVAAFENSEKTEEDIARVILAMSGLVPESDTMTVDEEDVQDDEVQVESASETVSEPTTTAVEELASEEELVEIAAELDEPTWNNTARRKFSARYADWLVTGEEMSAKLRKWFKKIVAVLSLSGVVAFSLKTNLTTQHAVVIPVSVEDLQPILPEISEISEKAQTTSNDISFSAEDTVVSNYSNTLTSTDDTAGFIGNNILPTPVSPKIPSAADQHMSPAARAAYRQLVPAVSDDLRRDGKFLIMADKPSATIFVFTATGELVLQQKMLVGKTVGDFGIEGPKTDRNKITPAGLFRLGLRDASRGGSEAKTAGEYDFGKVYVLDKAIDGEYSSTILHSVWTGESDASERLAALSDRKSEKSRFSFGCINVDKETFRTLTTNYSGQMDGARIFIVPDQQDNVDDFLYGDAARNQVKRDYLTRDSIPPPLPAQLSATQTRLKRGRMRRRDTDTNNSPAVGRYLRTVPEPSESTVSLLNTVVDELPLNDTELHQNKTQQRITKLVRDEMKKNTKPQGKGDNFRFVVKLGSIKMNELMGRVWKTKNRVLPGWKNFRSQEAILQRAKVISYEIASSLSKTGSGYDWYSRKINEMYQKLSRFYPELREPGRDRFIFSTILAITSNGENVFSNMVHTLNLYNKVRGQGRMPNMDDATGEARRENAMFKGFATVQRLIDQNGWQQVDSDFRKNVPYREMKKRYGISANEETADQLVSNAYVLGSKIGAFWGNLNGNFGHIAMDLWFTRTMARLSGDFKTLKPKQLLALEKHYRMLTHSDNVPDDVKSELRHFLSSIPKPDEASNWTSVPEEVRSQIPLAYKWVKSAYNTLQNRKDPETGKGFYKPSSEEGSAKLAHIALDQANRAPDDAEHRQWMRRVMNTAQKHLKANGIDLSLAEMQAVMWFYEKDLYTKFGATSKRGERADFSEAADYGLARVRQERFLRDAGPRQDDLVQGTLFQSEEVSDPSIPRGFYDTARRAGTAVIGFVQGVSRPDTGVHESAHAIYEFLVESGEVTKEQQAAFDEWQSNGNPKATWEEKNEKFADGFIKFVLDGVSTGIDAVDAVFAKITKSLVAIYKNLSSSRVNMEIPQEVREIFEKIIKRGYELEQAGKPLQKVPVKITTVSKADAPRIPQTKPTTPTPTTQPANKVTKKLPRYKAPVVGVGLRQELTDEVRNKYDLPGSRAVLGQTDQEAWDAALLSIAEADRYENASEQERMNLPDPPLVGDRLIHDLIDNPRIVDKTGRALLAHALLTKKQNLDGLRKKISALPTTASKLDRSELTRQENEAISQLSVVVKTIERQGSLAGLALQAMKMVVNEEFELDTMLAQALNWKRSSGQNAGSSVLSETEKKRVGEIQARLEKAQKELDDAMADNEMLSNENAAYERELLALIEKQAKREKTPPSEQKRATVAKKITDRVSSARDRLAKMGFGGRLQQSQETTLLYQKPEPEALDPQVLSDLAEVGVEYLNNGDATIGKFTDSLVSEFGDAIKPHAKQILAESRKRFKSVAATTKGPRSVEQLLADVDSEAPKLTRELVYNMAKAVYNQGFRKEEILDQVTGLLQDEFPDVTRSEVADAFTGYGKIKYPSQEKIDKDLRELRNAERITRQIEDVESGQPPKATGTRRDKATVWVREKMALLKAAMKKAGMESIPGADRLKGTLDSIKSNYLNRIEEFERAIANHEKLPPKTRGVTYDEEAIQLKEKAAKLKEEYDGIFGENKDLTEEQRMERAINSLSRRIKEEKDMRAAGQTKRVPGKPAPDSPAIRILREELKALVDARHAAAKALVDSRTPEERALDRAVRSVEKSIAENERILATGQLPAPRAGAPSYTPSQWLQTQRDRLQTLQRQVAKLRRDNRPRLSAEEKERRRAISYLTKAITRLQSVVNAGVVVSRTRPDSSKYDPAVSLLRREHARLKAQVQDMRKSLKGPRDPEILLLSQLRRKLAAIRDRIKRGDFTKTTKQPKQYSDRVLKAKLEIAEANAEWNRFRGQMRLAQASRLKRLTRTLEGLWQLRKIIVMGLEPGALGRQAGRALLANWWNFRNFSIIGKSLRAGFSRAKEFEYYDQFVNRPGSVWDKVGGIVLHSPHEEGYKNKEDLPDPEILEALSKVKALKYPTEVLLFFERFTRTLLNAQRVTEFDGFNPKNREEAILFGNAVMNVTGGGSFEDTRLETGVMLANYAVVSTRWYVSRAKLAILEPVWSKRQGVGYEGTAKARLRILNKYYAQYYMGKAILTFSLMAIAAMRNGWDDDDNDWKEQLNPLSSKFLTFRYKGSVVDTGSGVRQFINLLTRAGAGKKMNSNGELVDITGDDKPFTPDLSDEVSNFAFDRMNVNLAFMLQTANRRYRNGDEVTPLNVLKNLLTPITAGDARTLFETYETDEAAALYVLSYLGFSVFTKDANRSKFSTEPRY